MNCAFHNVTVCGFCVLLTHATVNLNKSSPPESNPSFRPFTHFAPCEEAGGGVGSWAMVNGASGTRVRKASSVDPDAMVSGPLMLAPGGGAGAKGAPIHHPRFKWEQKMTGVRLPLCMQVRGVGST